MKCVNIYALMSYILVKTLCPQRHSKVCFEILKTFWVTLQDSCPNLENLLQNHSFIKRVT